MAADEVGSTAARAVAPGAILQCLDDGRVGGQAEVVVAAEGQHLAAVHDLARCAGAVRHAQAADQALCGKQLQLAVDSGDQVHHHQLAITDSKTFCVRAARPATSSSLST